MTVNVTKPAINVREKLAELDKPTGIAGEAMLRAETPQEQFNLIGAGRRNILINGDFDVWQRGTSSITSNGYGSADRWKHYTAGVGGATFAQNSDGNMHITVTGSGSGTARVGQMIEFPEKYHGKTVTFSAMVKSNSEHARLLCDTNTQWYSATDRHSGSGEWEKLQMTFTLEESGVTFLRFTVGLDGYQSANVSLTSANYVTIKEVQLELGKVATPFEHRSYGEELALCQRYYQVIPISDRVFSSYNNSSASYGGSFQWFVPMRTAPTVQGGTNATAFPSNSPTSVSGKQVMVQTTYTTSCLAYLNYDTADAHSWFVRADNLLLDAEL